MGLAAIIFYAAPHFLKSVVLHDHGLRKMLSFLRKMLSFLRKMLSFYAKCCLFENGDPKKVMQRRYFSKNAIGW